MKKHYFIKCLLFIMCLTSANALLAQSYIWDGSTSSVFKDTTNWSGATQPTFEKWQSGFEIGAGDNPCVIDADADIAGSYTFTMLDGGELVVNKSITMNDIWIAGASTSQITINNGGYINMRGDDRIQGGTLNIKAGGGFEAKYLKWGRYNGDDCKINVEGGFLNFNNFLPWQNGVSANEARVYLSNGGVITRGDSAQLRNWATDGGFLPAQGSLLIYTPENADTISSIDVTLPETLDSTLQEGGYSMPDFFALYGDASDEEKATLNVVQTPAVGTVYSKGEKVEVVVTATDFFNNVLADTIDLNLILIEPKVEVVVVTPAVNNNDTATIKAIAGYMDSTVYNVTVLEKSVLELSDTTQLNAADVVIMGRNIGSSDVGSGRAAWDAVKSPIISMNPWGLRGRSDKAAWTSAYNCDNMALADTVALAGIITATNDIIFADLTNDTIDWWFGNYSAFRADDEGDDAGNGQLLAKTADNRPLFIRWAAGVEFYEGAGHTPMGDRTYIGCGSDDDDIINYFGFSEVSEKIFFAELARLASGEPTVIPLHTDASLADIAVAAGTIAPEFSAETTSYTVELPLGTTEAPAVTATVNDYKASFLVDAATDLSDSTTITVMAEDTTITMVYSVKFTVEPKIEVVVVTPEVNGNDTAVVQAIAAYMDSAYYNVTVLEKSVLELSDTTQLNAADVVIMGRKIGSSDVGSGRAAWDAVKSPVISMNPWGLRGRSDKGAWTPAYDCDNMALADSVALAGIVVAPNDPVFAGVTNDTIDWWFGNYSAFRADAEGDDAGNGQLLAQTTDNRPLFIRWAAGVEFYDGAGHTPMGDRSFIGCGSDNGGVINYFGFSEVSEKIFFAELARLASGEPTVIPARKNASLATLSASVGTMAPVLSVDVLSYSVEVPFGTTDVPVITATAADSKATTEVVNASSLTDSTIVTVTAEDTTVTQVYTIRFTVAAASTDAALASLTTSLGQYLPDFHVDTMDYVVYLPAGTTDVPTLTATAADGNATVDVAQAGSLSETAVITVTAQDVTVTKVYSVTFSVVNSVDNTSLSAVKVYPSPATNFIKVSNVEAGVVSIISLGGVVVSQTSIVADDAINVSALNSGIYVIKIETKDGVLISNFVKN